MILSLAKPGPKDELISDAERKAPWKGLSVPVSAGRVPHMSPMGGCGACGGLGEDRYLKRSWARWSSGTPTNVIQYNDPETGIPPLSVPSQRT